MGENKAFIEIEGIPLIHRICNLFHELFEEVIIVGNEREAYSTLDAKFYHDVIPNLGALGGLYTGLLVSTFHASLCVACDMPFLKKALIEYLITTLGGYDAIVPRTKDGLQPLLGLYTKRCLEPIRKTVGEGKVRIIDFYSLAKIRILDESEFVSCDPGLESFINVNTPEELRSIRFKRRAF